MQPAVKELCILSFLVVPKSNKHGGKSYPHATDGKTEKNQRLESRLKARPGLTPKPWCWLQLGPWWDRTLGPKHQLGTFQLWRPLELASMGVPSSYALCLVLPLPSFHKKGPDPSSFSLETQGKSEQNPPACDFTRGKCWFFPDGPSLFSSSSCTVTQPRASTGVKS